MLYDKAKEFYERDREAYSVDPEIVRSALEREYPRQFDIMDSALTRVETGESVSVNNIVAEFVAARKFLAGQLLATALLNGQPSEELLDNFLKVSGLADDTEGDLVDEVYIGLDLESLGGAVDPSKLIRLLPDILNEKVGGGALKKQHILVFARPETGKSLFTINLTRGFLEDSHTVLYINNEGPQEAMRVRAVSSLLDKPKQAIMTMSNEQVKEQTKAAGGDNLIFVNLSPGTFSQIRGLCDKFRPDVLIVDQIRNLATGAEGLTHGQEVAGITMRNLAISHDLLAISVAQAGESANDKLQLGLSDIDSSKTGLPASLDLMIGIGVNEDYERRSKRMVSLPKNKLSGDHSCFSITVNEATSRVL